jgi:hypothetical protein
MAFLSFASGTFTSAAIGGCGTGVPSFLQEKALKARKNTKKSGYT